MPFNFEPTGRMDAGDRAPSTTFLLGVGCQKGGTTWLSDYLRRHPDTDMGICKEYHVLDALRLPSRRNFIESATACVRQMLEWFSQPRTSPAECTLLDFHANIEVYFDYFYHLATHRPGVRLVGDMTPSYAGLSAEVFAFVLDAIEKRGLAVKVLFIMRDPVDRVWSAVRMKRRRRSGTDGTDAAWVRKLYQSPNYELRTRYDKTIRNLDAAFPSQQIHFQFYETLFSTETIRAITDFLGIRFVEPEFEVRSNASPKTESLPTDLQREVADFYRPAYEFCAARFGDNLLRRLWPSYRFIEPDRTAIPE